MSDASAGYDGSCQIIRQGVISYAAFAPPILSYIPK
jgi:hypothetical protein